MHHWHDACTIDQKLYMWLTSQSTKLQEVLQLGWNPSLLSNQAVLCTESHDALWLFRANIWVRNFEVVHGALHCKHTVGKGQLPVAIQHPTIATT